MLLLLLSAAFFFYDRLRTDEKILNEIQLTLQDDFEACLRYYSAERTPDQEPPQGCVACELEYDKSNRLIKWSATKYLPRAHDINRLRDLQKGPLMVLGNRTYYQLRRGEGDHTLVDLIPLSITYEINNEFLAPYYFLGRWHEKFREYSQYLTFSAGSSEGDIKIRDASGKPAFAISNLIYEPMRIRNEVLGVDIFQHGFACAGCFCPDLHVPALGRPLLDQSDFSRYCPCLAGADYRDQYPGKLCIRGLVPARRTRLSRYFRPFPR